MAIRGDHLKQARTQFWKILQINLFQQISETPSIKQQLFRMCSLFRLIQQTISIQSLRFQIMLWGETNWKRTAWVLKQNHKKEIWLQMSFIIFVATSKTTSCHGQIKLKIYHALFQQQIKIRLFLTNKIQSIRKPCNTSIKCNQIKVCWTIWNKLWVLIEIIGPWYKFRREFQIRLFQALGKYRGCKPQMCRLRSRFKLKQNNLR